MNHTGDLTFGGVGFSELQDEEQITQFVKLLQKLVEKSRNSNTYLQLVERQVALTNVKWLTQYHFPTEIAEIFSWMNK